MSLPRPGLYLVTPEQNDTARLLALCEMALAGRPALLQYRAKHASQRVREAQAGLLLEACRRAGVPLLINDDLELALALGADGVHLGRDDGAPAQARARLGAGRLLGVSCYDDPGRAREAIAAGADYVAFGAVFASPTKPAAVRAPLALLRAASRELQVPLAAIGGITLANAPAVIDAGARWLAVISDVFDDPDPAGRARAYAGLFDGAARPRSRGPNPQGSDQ